MLMKMMKCIALAMPISNLQERKKSVQSCYISDIGGQRTITNNSNHRTIKILLKD